ncbi:MAG: TetR/AcrR family transcriptional regulator [Elusimicrobia bacterium]|nr:TetR/AcrR family transcriptional regulator [Elusimicrobiota bacterium]
MKPLTDTEKRAKEAALVRAAARVMSSRGLDSMTMDEVAREAGVAKGTLFLYFRKKEDLVQAVFAEMAGAFGGVLAELGSSPLEAGELFRALVTALLAHFDKKRDITGYSGGLPLSGPRREALRTRFASNMRLIADILSRCSEEGFLKLEDPLFAASALFGLCRGSNTYARAAGRTLPLGERARRVTEIFLRGAGRPE